MAMLLATVCALLLPLVGSERSVRLAIPDEKHHWPNGEIPYVFEPTYPQRHRQAVLAAMENMMFLTRVNGKDCIRFVPLTNQSYHVLIANTRCFAIIGRSTTHVTHMYVGGGCHSEFLLKHELMHVLGFMHEHCRSDRDNYITVNWTNVASGKEGNFDKSKTYTHDLPYDYYSIIHYYWNAFAQNGKYATLTPTQPDLILPTHPPEPKDVCTFEEDTCGWIQATDDDFDWRRFKGHTPTPRTGPSFDARGNITGYYIFADTSGHHRKSARLQSPVYPPGPYCLQMAYHMYGWNMGSLKVLTMTPGYAHVHLDKSARQGDLWEHTEIYHYSKRNFQFELQATIGNGPFSDIAVDNLVVRHGRCSQAGHLIIG